MRFIFLIILSLSSPAHAELCNPDQQFCANDHNHSSSSSGGGRSSPTSSSKFNFNPSTVPTRRGLGIEFIYFKSIDFSLVTGTGRVGAAISPMNSDETFFGAPAFEQSADYLQRKIDQTKYASQKYTLATAFNIYDNQESGLGHVAMNLGVMAKYNTISKTISPGGGLSGLLGPLSFSYAIYKDESDMDLSAMYPGTSQKALYTVQTYSLGLSLGSLSLDYSVLNLALNDLQQTGIQTFVGTPTFSSLTSIATATLFYKSAIFTASARQENSDRPAYDYESKTLITQQIKNEYFGSAQLVVTNHFFVGAFYNYYLLRELSGGITVFF